ncbi:MAG: phage recombination protein Bet [Alphaproteobacteria bacterium]|nr:phage recombination protein Bet [Alphaproteobacteria bacterium]
MPTPRPAAPKPAQRPAQRPQEKQSNLATARAAMASVQQKHDEPRETSRNVPAVARTRLPWNPAMGKEFAEMGVSAASWRTLVEAIWPEAKTAESVGMALAYCKARKLDPFKKPVHIVPVWHSGLGKMVETVWPSISELRTTAARTGAYAGKDQVVYGPMVEAEVGRVTIEFPEWAQLTVYRMVGGQRCAFEGDPVYWLEAYAPKGGKEQDESPNRMWSKRTRGQLAKVAEAQALRQAFPEEIGGDYSAEEMAGQIIGHEIIDARAAERPARRQFSMASGTFKDGVEVDPAVPPEGVDAPSPEEATDAPHVDEADAGDGNGGSPEDENQDDAPTEEEAFVIACEEALKGEMPLDRHLILEEGIADLMRLRDDVLDKGPMRDRVMALIDIYDTDAARAAKSGKDKR